MTTEWGTVDPICRLLVLYAVSAIALEAAERVPELHSLQVIVLESYPYGLDTTTYDVTDLASADFPVRFSRLFAPFSRPQSIALPEKFNFPRAPMFLDIYTFDATESQIQKKKTFSRRNEIQDLDYKITFVSWSKGGYQVELRGRHSDLKWNDVPVEGTIERTKVVRIRHTANRVLFVILTAIEGLPVEVRGIRSKPEGVKSPTPISQPIPIYPSALSQTKKEGMVRIYCIVTREGRIDPEKFVVVECPHYLFARSSLDMVLNRWTFHPGTKDGSPVDVVATIEVSFRQR